MRNRLARTVCAVGAMALLCAQALPQQESVIAKIINNDIPSTMPIAEIKPEFKAIRLGVAQGSGGNLMDSFMGMLGGLMGGATGGGDSSGLGGIMAMGAMMIFGISWTKGETIKAGDQEFLITYKIELDQFLLSPDMDQEPDLSKMPLRLHLVNLKAINSITPLTELTKEKYIELLQGGMTPGSEPPMTSPPQEPITEDSPIEARKTATLSNLKQVSLGMIMYATDWDDELPYAQSTTAVKYVTSPYLKSVSSWKSYNPAGSQILFNTGVAGLNYYQIDSPAETVLFFENKAWPDGTRGVAFADGHCKFLDSAAFTAALNRSKIKATRKSKPLPADYGVKEVQAMGIP